VPNVKARKIRWTVHGRSFKRSVPASKSFSGRRQ
jgi:hypothetical protein